MINGVGTEKCYIVNKKNSDGAESLYFIPLEQALDYLQSVIRELAPVGLKNTEWRGEITIQHFNLFHNPTCYLLFERAGMHVSGSVVLHFHHDSSDNRVTHDGKHLRLWTVDVSVKWPSSEYTVAGALAATTLLQEITQFAALLKAALEHYPMGLVTDKVEV
ncbi:MAG: hypothetical protein WC479_08230 [Candidatus Izemoplasmatales bacterium]